MADEDLGGIIRAARKRAKMTQDELGAELGVTGQAVSQWERGETIPDTKNFRPLARLLKISEEVFPDIPLEIERATPERATIPIVGYVGANSQTHTYAVPAGSLDEIEAPDDATEQTVAVEIKGDSLGELFDRWIVFYDDVRSPVTSDLYGKLCVVGLADERILIKKIRRRRDGRFDLVANTEDGTIENAAILWAAKVKHMVPR